MAGVRKKQWSLRDLKPTRRNAQLAYTSLLLAITYRWHPEHGPELGALTVALLSAIVGRWLLLYRRWKAMGGWKRRSTDA